MRCVWEAQEYGSGLPDKKVSNRLAGKSISNLLRLAQKFVDDRRSNGEVSIEAIGRKGRDYFRKRSYEVSGEHVGIVDKPTIDKAREIATRMIPLAIG